MQAHARITLMAVVLALVGCQKPPKPRACPPTQGQPDLAAVDAMHEAILARLDLKPGTRLADIGTGGGWFTTRAALALGATGLVYGTDVDPRALAQLSGPPRPGAAPIETRLVRGQRETGLDDVPEGSVDVILMIDSLCFYVGPPREMDVQYLHKFLRILRPGGRFIHHMDCTCRTSPAEIEKLFTNAGFAPKVQRIDLPCATVPQQSCATAEREELARYLPVFYKPGAAAAN